MESSMEFIEKSEGVYRPIEDLFDTHMYMWAVRLCWSGRSYKSQIALLVELLKLQQKNQIPSEVTAEDMTDYIFQQSKNTYRERFWESDLEDLDEDDDKSLLQLVWTINTSNKKRDVEFAAKMLLQFPEDIPPKFLHPRVLSTANDFAKILREKQQEGSSSKRLSPQEIVIEVVPKVLQAFWVPPHRPQLTRHSKTLSKLSVGVTKATLDRLSNALTRGENQAAFSRCIRNFIILSSVTEIRQMYSLDILEDSIMCFAPELLSKIADVSVRHISGLFQPNGAKVPAQLTPTNSLVQDDISADVTEQQGTLGPDTNRHVVLSIKPIPHYKPYSLTETQVDGNELQKSCVNEDLKSTREEDSAGISPPFPASPAESASSPKNQAHKDELQDSWVDEDSMSSREKTAVVTPAPLDERSNLQEDSEVIVASPAPSSPHLERVIPVTDLSEVQETEEERKVGFFLRCQPLCCRCFADSNNTTN